MTADVYLVEDKDVAIKTSLDRYKSGDPVSFTLTNKASYEKYFQVASVEKWVGEEWIEQIWNAPCGCGDKCDYLGFVEPGKEATMNWDQSVSDKNVGCATASPGRYRVVIDGMYGWTNESHCMSVHSYVVSNEFEIE